MHIVETDMIKKMIFRCIFILDHPKEFPEFIGMELEDLVQLLINVERDKLKRDEITDSLINYDDEVVSIEELEEGELLDITVTGDNLFYANGILTKNSIGLPQSADFMIAAIRTEELDKLNQILIIQLKNRYNGTSKHHSFVVGVNIDKMQLYDTEEKSQQELISTKREKIDTKFDKSKLAEFS